MLYLCVVKDDQDDQKLEQKHILKVTSLKGIHI